jgi:excisionase family DNA binding protein
MTTVDRLYTPDQAARLLGCGRTKLYAFLKSGELRSVRLGRVRRIPRSALEEFIESLSDGES